MCCVAVCEEFHDMPTDHPILPTDRDRGTYHPNVERERERERVRRENDKTLADFPLRRSLRWRRPRRDASDGRSVGHVGTSRTIFRC